ncbi:uncharacterized protein LTR77_001417 [Saxophila tyrrhenica]|uniref:Uncharacterized protein n=1 Tax=Saxophila tyrrhenica TaxID=1690608 RepID=A0AAV9PPU6_9PEZI|nr:hypothetical protein LTR77_001417 [Saxophila tyrrhenica]
MAGLSEQIEALGQEYNRLEERITELERTNPNGKSHSHDLQSLSSKLPLALASIHHIAQELIHRLGNGDQLSLTIQAQLQASFGAELHAGVPLAKRTLPTPSLSDAATKRKSTESTEGFDRPAKRPRGRPPKNGVYARKLSTDSSSSNSAKEKSTDLKQTTPKVKKPLGRPRKSVATPPQQTSRRTTGSDASTAQDVSLASNKAAPSKASDADVTKTKENRTPAKQRHEDTTQDYIDSGMDVDDEGERNASVSIPPERRSTRTPKPTEKANFISWKQYNEMQ